MFCKVLAGGFGFRQCALFRSWVVFLSVGGGAAGGGSSELDLEFLILCCGVWVVGRSGEVLVWEWCWMVKAEC
ncbi:hypothetical protein P8452_17982 [Trifolium repens]|nr:hypothetical protein P8452_17982 [Trifolium repens]